MDLPARPKRNSHSGSLARLPDLIAGVPRSKRGPRIFSNTDDGGRDTEAWGTRGLWFVWHPPPQGGTAPQLMNATLALSIVKAEARFAELLTNITAAEATLTKLMEASSVHGRNQAKALGHSIGAIAQAVGRPKSTISRELSRNKLPSGRYSPLHAAGAYQLRRRREALIERDRALRTFVVDRLAEGWTPEQISGWLKGGNERRLRAVNCETIYAFIYRAAQRAEQLWRYLTRRHKRRRPRRSRPSQDTIKDRVSIHERPKTVDG